MEGESFRDGVRCGWRKREKWRQTKVAKGEGKKSGGGSKSGDGEITAQRQEAELRGPQGFGVYV